MTTRALTKPIFTPSIFDDFFKPWNEIFDESRWMNKMMTVPAVNIKQETENYLVSLAVPGLKKEDLHIDMEGNMLTISSEKEEKFEEKEDQFTRKEYNYSSFSRSFTLPEDVKLDMIDARYEDGVLTIKLPRMIDEKHISTSKKIEVK